MLTDELYSVLNKERVFTDPASCSVYGYDNSRHKGYPICVVFPILHEEVVQIVQIARKYKVPMVCRGLGSNTTGASVPIHGAIILSFEKFNRILDVNIKDRLMIVEPGVTNQAVQEAAKVAGFFWAPDPGSAAFCTIGGNINCNAAGPRAIKYGTTRENILGLTAVTGNGATIHCGGYTTKESVGYDLTRLFIGSEGTLGIITQAILKLTPLAEAELTLRIGYQDIGAATLAISRIMTQSITPCALEFLDAKALELLKHYGHLELSNEAKALLLVKLDGMRDTLETAAQAIRLVCDGDKLCFFDIATDAATANLFWQARKSLSPTLRTLAPNKINEDIIVPVSQIANFIEYIETISEKYNLLIVNFGHAGNGNIHVNILYDAKKISNEYTQKALTEIFRKAIQLGGTLSGEHGIGLEKKSFLPLIFSKEKIDIMKSIKSVFDPDNLLNPGKIFPDTSINS